MKYYILLNDDSNCDKYVIVNDTIKDMYNVIIKLNNRCTDLTKCEYTNLEIIKYSLNVNYLTKQRLSSLLKIYAFYYNKFFFNNDVNIDKVLLSSIGICPSIINSIENSILNLNKYLDSLVYKSIYEKELDKILLNLPDICISNIKSKKKLNYSNNNNCQNKFIEVN